jgi:hypothetical protein
MSKKVIRRRAKSSPTVSLRPATRVPQAETVQIGHAEIAKRAYEIWQRKGRPADDGSQNWAEAEAELRAAMSKKSKNDL